MGARAASRPASGALEAQAEAGDILARLPEPERTQALQRLSEWMGVPQGARASALTAGGAASGGEDIAPLVDGHPWL